MWYYFKARKRASRSNLIPDIQEIWTGSPQMEKETQLHSVTPWRSIPAPKQPLRKLGGRRDVGQMPRELWEKTSEVILLCADLGATSVRHSGSARASPFGSPRSPGRKDKMSIVSYFFCQNFSAHANPRPSLLRTEKLSALVVLSHQVLPPSQPANFTWTACNVIQKLVSEASSNAENTFHYSFAKVKYFLLYGMNNTLVLPRNTRSV